MSVDSVDLVVVGAGPAGLGGRGGRGVRRTRRRGRRVPRPAAVCPARFTRSRSCSASKMAYGGGKSEVLMRKASSVGAVILCGVSVWGVSPGWFVGTTPADPSRSGRKVPIGFRAKAC